MALTYTENPEDAVVEIRMAGLVTAEEFNALIEKMQSSIDAHGTLRFIEILDTSTDVDPTLAQGDIRFDIRNFRRTNHVAVVSDARRIGPVSKTAGATLPTRLRMFDMAHLEEARAWIRAPDLAGASV